MKKFLIIMLVLGLFICMIGAAFAAKKYDGETMQVYLGILPNHLEEVMDYIAPKLEEKYGIKLAAEEMGSTTQIQKLLLMQKKPTVTIAGMDGPVAIQASDMGLLEPIDPEKAPNIKDLFDWAVYRDEEGIKFLASKVSAIGLLYNEDAFQKNGWEPPTSWEDLWRPELSGLISITAPESTYGLCFLVALARIEGGGEDNLQPGMEKLKTLLPNIHTVHTWSSELAKLLQLNEVVLGTTGSDMIALRDEGFPARWVAPQELTPALFGGVVLVKDAPYQDVAYDYLNLYFSKEFSLMRTRTSGQVSANPLVWEVLSEEEKAKLPIQLEDLDELTMFDWTKINQNKNEWTETFHKEISK